MPDSFYVFDITCPLSTDPTAPVEVPMAMDPGVLVELTVVIPAGHSGLTGIAFGYGHMPIIPSNTGAYISGDDETVPVALVGEPAGVSWSAFVCNDDLIDHTWQVRVGMNNLPGRGAASLEQPPLPVAAIYAAAPATVAASVPAEGLPA